MTKAVITFNSVVALQKLLEEKINSTELRITSEDLDNINKPLEFKLRTTDIDMPESAKIDKPIEPWHKQYKHNHKRSRR